MATTETSLMTHQHDPLLIQETNLVAKLANASAHLNSTYDNL